MQAYTFTPAEAAIYDSGDDIAGLELLRDLRSRFNGSDTEVYHPSGFVVIHYPSNIHASYDMETA